METNVWKVEIDLRKPTGNRIRVKSLKADGTLVVTEQPLDRKADIGAAFKIHDEMVNLNGKASQEKAHQMAVKQAQSQSGE
jgi:hypothetical protein